MEPDSANLHNFDVRVERGSSGDYQSVVTVPSFGGSERFIMRIKVDGDELSQDTLELLAAYQGGASNLSTAEAAEAHAKMTAISVEVNNIFTSQTRGLVAPEMNRVIFTAENITHKGDHRKIRAAFSRSVQGKVPTAPKKANDSNTKAASQRLYDALKGGSGRSVRSAQSSLATIPSQPSISDRPRAQVASRRTSSIDSSSSSASSEKISAGIKGLSEDLSSKSLNSLTDAARKTAESLSSLVDSIKPYDRNAEPTTKAGVNPRVSAGIDFGDDDNTDSSAVISGIKSVLGGLSDVVSTSLSGSPTPSMSSDKDYDASSEESASSKETLFDAARSTASALIELLSSYKGADMEATKKDRTAKWVLDSQNVSKQASTDGAPSLDFKELMKWAKTEQNKIGTAGGKLEISTAKFANLPEHAISDSEGSSELIGEYAVGRVANAVAGLYSSQEDTSPLVFIAENSASHIPEPGAPSGYSSSAFAVASIALEDRATSGTTTNDEQKVGNVALTSARETQISELGQSEVEALVSSRQQNNQKISNMRKDLQESLDSAEQVSNNLPNKSIEENPSEWGALVGNVVSRSLPSLGTGSVTQLILPLVNLPTGTKTTNKFIKGLLSGSKAKSLYISVKDEHGNTKIKKATIGNVLGGLKLKTVNADQMDSKTPVVEIIDRNSVGNPASDLSGVNVRQVWVTNDGSRQWRASLENMLQAKGQMSNSTQGEISAVIGSRPSSVMLDNGEMLSIENFIAQEARVSAATTTGALLSAAYITSVSDPSDLVGIGEVIGTVPGAFSQLGEAQTGLSAETLTTEIATTLLLASSMPNNENIDGLGMLLSARDGSQLQTLMRRVLSHQDDQGGSALIRSFLLPLASGQLTSGALSLKQIEKDHK